jgi:hypothetical protein
MFLAERFHYSRAYAGLRVRDAGTGARLRWAAMSFGLPALLVARLFRDVVARRRHLGWFVASLPLVLLFSVVWAYGELVGYLTGPGDSIVRVK